MRFDHSNLPPFVDYYARQSLTEASRRRLARIRELVLTFIPDSRSAPLNIADIGCGAGSLSLLWAQCGHRVYGLDVSAALLSVAHDRAKDFAADVTFQLGSATNLPWKTASMDVCCVPELLEHVPDWRACLDEFARILRPGGVLFLTTTNRLCPRQQEFTLPLYSWYPPPLKRFCERLAMTSHPGLAGHATYPALHWFTFYQLRRELRSRRLYAFDRFDVMDLSTKSAAARALVSALRRHRGLRFLGHVATASTLVLAIKERELRLGTVRK